MIVPPPAAIAFSVASYGLTRASSAGSGARRRHVGQLRDERQRKQRQPRIEQQRAVAGLARAETRRMMPIVGVSVTPDFAIRSIDVLVGVAVALCFGE